MLLASEIRRGGNNFLIIYSMNSLEIPSVFALQCHRTEKYIKPEHNTQLWDFEIKMKHIRVSGNLSPGIVYYYMENDV